MSLVLNSKDFSHIRLALFVDSSLHSRVVLEQMQTIMGDLKIDENQIHVYNVHRDIDMVNEFRVIACPTLVRLDLHPPKFLIGELNNKMMVVAFLSLIPRSTEA